MFGYIKIKIASVLITISMLLISSVVSQTSTSALKGRVIDSTGSIVTGASVVLINNGNGLRKTFSTDETGSFNFTFIEPGLYDIEATFSGFKTYKQQRIPLEVGRTTEINVTLETGNVEEAVNINSVESVQLETTSGTLGGIVERNRVESLPLNGRNIFQLAQLEPGSTSSPSARGANPDLTTTGEISINGGRALNNEFIIDGIPLTNKGDNRVSLKPSVDSIQEFKIETNSYSAEYGRSGGGAVNFSTRSGTTQYTGALWEYLRNDALDARSYFVNADPKGVKEKLRFNQLGANLGGPIYLPSFGKHKSLFQKSEKLFFFFNFENLRISQSQQRPSTVPSSNMRNGDFSELLGSEISGIKVLDTNGNLITARIGQIYVPGAVVPKGQPGAGSRVAFANNIIPASLINPVAKAALAYYPLPNTVGQLNSNGNGFSNNYIANTQLRTDARQYTARVDYNISSAQQLYGRVIFDDNELFNSGLFPGNIASPQANPIQTAKPGTVVLSYVNSISSKIVLYFNAGATRFNNDAESFSKGFDPSTLGIPDYITNSSADTNIFPTFNPNGYTTLGPPRNFGFFRNNQDVFSFNQSLNLLSGRHSIKVGANQRVYRAYNYRPDDPVGNYRFSPAFTARVPADLSLSTGDSIASFLLGNPVSARLAIAPQIAVQSTYYAVFVQDDWTIGNRLTLNLGLRWETDRPNTERFNRLTNFDPGAKFPVENLTVNFPASTGLSTRNIPLTGVITPVGRAGVKDRNNFDSDLNNWGPRIGIAFKINDKTVLRAGGGIFFAPLSGGGFNTVTYAISDLAETPFIATLDNGMTPAPETNLSNPFPSGIVQPVNQYTGALTGYGNQSIPVRLRSTKQPYIGQWNLSIQRELPWQLVAQAAYAGSAGVGLLGASTDLNQLSGEALSLVSKTIDGKPLGNIAIANPFLQLPAELRPSSTSILGSPTITIAQLLRPYPQFGNIVSYGHNIAHSSYHSFQLKVSRRLVDGLTFTTGYTFSKLIDDLTSNSINLSVQMLNYQNYYDLRADKSISNFDVRHRFVGSVTWELPFGRDKKFLREGILSKFVGGFTWNSIVQAQTGFPLSISTTNAALQGLAFIALRPNLNDSPLPTTDEISSRLNQYFNTRAFSQPAPYTFGNAPRSFSNLRGPNSFITNMSLHRNFTITEKVKLQTRVEAFNVFNKANFLPPGTVLGASGFGVISATEDPRQIQLALRLNF